MKNSRKNIGFFVTKSLCYLHKLDCVLAFLPPLLTQIVDGMSGQIVLCTTLFLISRPRDNRNFHLLYICLLAANIRTFMENMEIQIFTMKR